MPTVYSPVRGKHVRMKEDLLKYQKFVAGTNGAAVERAKAVFVAAGMKVATMATPEALELGKLCETTYFGVLLAWAQEMERFTKQMHADYLDLARFFEEIDYLPRVTFRPGHIGGHCVMPNIAILKSRFVGLLDAIVHSNELKAAESRRRGARSRKESRRSSSARSRASRGRRGTTVAMQAKARAHANIALVKYWGKRDVALNLPATGSLSLTLDALSTETTVELVSGLAADELTIDGREDAQELARVSRFLTACAPAPASRSRPA